MSIVSRIKSSFNLMKKRNWEKIYVAVDIHETVLVPSYYNTEKFKYYPLAKKTLQMLSERKDVCLILWTSTWDDTANVIYRGHFQRNNINFPYINENPECTNNDLACFNKKFYFDVGIDDRCGFNAKYGWLPIYLYLKWKKLKEKIFGETL